MKTIQSASLNKAASSLYITQPALSQAIKNFENELNITLLQRSSSGVTPTLYGQKVYRDCQNILNGLQNYYDSWQSDIKRYQQAQGVVNIGAAPMIGSHLASSFAFEVQKLCPNIHVSVLNILLRHRPLTFLQSFLDSPSINISIGVFEEDSEQKYLAFLQSIKNANLRIKILYKDEFKILINRKNKLAKKPALSLEDLASLNKISYYEDRCETDDAVRFAESDMYAQTLDHLIQMLNHNLGVMVAGAKIAEKHFIAQSNMVKIMDLENSPYPPLYSYIIYLPEEQLTESEKIIIELLGYYFEDGSAEDFIKAHQNYL